MTGIVVIALGAGPCLPVLCTQLPGPPVQAVLDGVGLLGNAADAAAAIGSRVLAWIGDSYARAPALMLGLAALLSVPLLAMFGLVFNRRRRPAGMTVALRRRAPEAVRKTSGDSGDGLTWPVDAWIEVDGKSGARFPVGRELLRIGRDEDNDLVLPFDTVHRYHAVIHRTEDAEIVVIDMAGADGNGVLVNGKRVSRMRLASGDTIELGEARLRFASRRA